MRGPQHVDEQSGTVGEDTLSRFAEIARQCTRRQDIIGRFEGDAFLFIFSGVGIPMAAAIARRIHDTMAAVFAANDIRGISFSAGFMELNSRQLAQMSGDEILRITDSCLRTARERGGSLFISKELTAKLKG